MMIIFVLMVYFILTIGLPLKMTVMFLLYRQSIHSRLERKLISTGGGVEGLGGGAGEGRAGGRVG